MYKARLISSYIHLNTKSKWVSNNTYFRWLVWNLSVARYSWLLLWCIRCLNLLSLQNGKIVFELPNEAFHNDAHEAPHWKLIWLTSITGRDIQYSSLRKSLELAVKKHILPFKIFLASVGIPQQMALYFVFLQLIYTWEGNYSLIYATYSWIRLKCYYCATTKTLMLYLN